MTFDPKKHLIRVQGNREYLPVSARLVWFRSEHPDWGIMTAPVEINLEKQYAIFSSTITDSDGKVIATATKMENVRGFGDYLEKAETGSVGRALAYCGYGTQFAPELEEGTRLADAPKESRPPQSSTTNNYQRTTPEPKDGDVFDPTAAPTSGKVNCSADACTAVLTQGQAAMSEHKFGTVLCLTHQKELQR